MGSQRLSPTNDLVLWIIRSPLPEGISSWENNWVLAGCTWKIGGVQFLDFGFFAFVLCTQARLALQGKTPRTAEHGDNSSFSPVHIVLMRHTDTQTSWSLEIQTRRKPCMASIRQRWGWISLPVLCNLAGVAEASSQCCCLNCRVGAQMIHSTFWQSKSLSQF